MEKNEKSFIRQLFTPDIIEGSISYPLNKIIFGAYKIFALNISKFAFIGGWFALFITLMLLTTKQSIFCSMGFFNHSEICSDNMTLMLGVHILKWFILSVFIVRYYQAVWQNRFYNWKNLLNPQKEDFYTFITLIMWLLLNSVALVSLFLLIVREPNPNWKIELSYFGIVSIGFLVPFVLLRFYGILAEVCEGGKISSLKKIWVLTRGNVLKLICSMLVWILIFLSGSSYIYRHLSAEATNASWLTIFCAEYLCNLFEIFMFAIFINYCGLQKSFLNGEK